ncbi:MAG: cytochrome c oxidase subunit II, partial [Chloroflexota bacterium]
MIDFPFFPEQASTIAAQIDAIYFVLVGLSLAFAVPVALSIIFFAVRYRRGQRVNRSNPLHESLKIEFTWS